MRSVLIWTGTLVGSVALGAGMYTLVVAPGSSGLDVSGTSAALPSPEPTVLRFKTDIVKDPPKKKVVDVPVAVTREPAAAPAPQVRSYSQESSDDDGRASAGRTEDDNDGGGWSGGDDDSGGDDWSGGDESSDDSGDRWESDDDSDDSGAGWESDDDSGSEVEDSRDDHGDSDGDDSDQHEGDDD